MKMWNKTAKHQTLSSRPSTIYNRILSMILVIALIGSTFGGVASAADEVVNSVKILSNDASGTLYVDDNSIFLNVEADTSSGTRIVTADATWSSTSSSVKVDKGVVTATGPVTSATITARYKDKSAGFIVYPKYYYDVVMLKLESVDAPDKKDVELGNVINLAAVGSIVRDSTNPDITTTAQWTTSNSAVATVDKGTVKLLSAGEVTITVKSKGKSDSIALTVKSPYEKIIINAKDGDGKTLSSPIDMTIGSDKEVLLTAEAVLKSSGANKPLTDDATWTSSNISIVKIDENGELTTVGKGTATVSAKCFGLTASVTVIVRTEYEALKVTPDKAINVTLYGAKVELKATAGSGNPSNPSKDVTNDAEWKISDAGQEVAVIDKTTTAGKVYVVPKGTGSTQITVSYMGLTKSLSITVSPTITTVEISKDSLDVFVDDTATLPTVSGKTVAGDSKDISNLIEWTSSDASVLKIEDGKWKALKKGTATLTAKLEGATDAQDITDTITVEVHNKILTLVPSEDTVSVVIGKEVDFPKVQLIYEDGEEETISDKMVWKSSTPNLLVKPTKMKGLLAATATLTGTYLNKTVKIKVTVEEEFTSFVIAPTKVSVTLNKSQSIKVTGTTKSGKKVSLGSRVDWKASNEEHLTIKGATVKGLVEGSGKLTATVQGKSLEIPYVVTAKLSKLTASNTSFKSAIGDQLSVELSALYENGKTANVTSQAAWTTSKAEVATVADGKISVKGKGSASIKAVFGGKSVTIRVSVK